MYSGASYESDAYHIGYCAAKTTENDLRKVDFSKHLQNGKFAPVIIKNATEEGTGHHSVIKLNGEYYAIYHARDYSKTAEKKFRTARIARLIVKDGKIICPQHGESL